MPAGQDTNGSTLTRADVWQTILAVSADHYGLHLNTEGETFKLRVPDEAEKQELERVHARRAPARRQYIVERASSNIPVYVIVRRLRDDFTGKLRIHDHNGEAKAMRRDDVSS